MCYILYNFRLMSIFREQAPKTTVIDTAKIQAPPGQGCPRCGGVVYAAEQVLAKGRVSNF